MTEKESGIPEYLMPLFTAKNAHDVIRNAELLVRDSLPEDQTKLLHTEAFTNIVFQALDGMDECVDEHYARLIGAFAEENVDEAVETFEL
jgi:hypothetical protein